MSKDDLRELLYKTASDFAEHFDAVQILASVADDDGTHFIARGSGNFYARQGMAHEFIKAEEADTIARSIVEKQSDNE